MKHNLHQKAPLSSNSCCVELDLSEYCPGGGEGKMILRQTDSYNLGQDKISPEQLKKKWSQR